MIERDIHVALADRASREELLRTTRVVARQDPDGLADLADRLIRQARRVSPEALRHVTAGLDLIRAERAGVAGRWTEVADRLARSGSDMVALLEGAAPDVAWLTGALALVEGRTADARSALRAARDRFAVDTRWVAAGDVASVLAQHCDGDDLLPPGADPVVQAIEFWAAMAARCAAAGQPARAAECADRTYELVVRSMPDLAETETRRLAARVLPALDVVRAHGSACARAELGMWAGGAAGEAGLGLPMARELFSEARAALPEAAGCALDAAEIDVAEARALVAQLDFVAAEPLLHRAIARFKALGDTEQVEVCEAPLTAVLGMLEPDRQRFGRAAARAAWTAHEGPMHVQAMRLVALLATDDLDPADPQLERLRRLADEHGDRAQVLTTEALAAIAALARGESGPARRWAASVRTDPESAGLPPSAQQRLEGLRLALLADADGVDGDIHGWLRGRPMSRSTPWRSAPACSPPSPRSDVPSGCSCSVTPLKRCGSHCPPPSRSTPSAARCPTRDAATAGRPR